MNEQLSTLGDPREDRCKAQLTLDELQKDVDTLVQDPSFREQHGASAFKEAHAAVEQQWRQPGGKLSELQSLSHEEVARRLFDGRSGVQADRL